MCVHISGILCNNLTCKWLDPSLKITAILLVGFYGPNCDWLLKILLKCLTSATVCILFFCLCPFKKKKKKTPVTFLSFCLFICSFWLLPSILLSLWSTSNTPSRSFSTVRNVKHWRKWRQLLFSQIQNYPERQQMWVKNRHKHPYTINSHVLLVCTQNITRIKSLTYDLLSFPVLCTCMWPSLY